MSKREIHINIRPYIEPHRVLAGPDWGAKVRQQVGLDSHDLSDETVILEIPDEVISLNSSFLRGFIRPSIMKLGAQGFEDKYTFKGPDFSEEVQDEIRRTLIYMQRLPAKVHVVA
jgi:hypothetical protein